MKWLRVLFTIVFLVCFGLFIFKFRENLYVLKEISLLQGLGFFFLSIITLLINGSKLKIIVESFQIRLKFREWFGLSAITLSLNSLVFKSGSIINATYLKKKHDFPYMSYVGTLGGDQLINLGVHAGVGFIISILMVAQGAWKWGYLASAFFILGTALFLLTKMPFPKIRQWGRIGESLDRAIQTLKTLFKEGRLFRHLSLLSVSLLVVISIRFVLASKVLHMEMPWSHCLIFTVALAFVRNLPMLQSDVGSRELVIGFLASYLGDGLKEGFLITAVDRIIVVFWCFVFAGFSHKMIRESGER